MPKIFRIINELPADLCIKCEFYRICFGKMKDYCKEFKT